MSPTSPEEHRMTPPPVETGCGPWCGTNLPAAPYVGGVE
jgi:hypothetical protein